MIQQNAKTVFREDQSHGIISFQTNGLKWMSWHGCRSISSVRNCRIPIVRMKGCVNETYRNSKWREWKRITEVFLPTSGDVRIGLICSKWCSSCSCICCTFSYFDLKGKKNFFIDNPWSQSNTLALIRFWSNFFDMDECWSSSSIILQVQTIIIHLLSIFNLHSRYIFTVYHCYINLFLYT